MCPKRTRALARVLLCFGLLRPALAQSISDAQALEARGDWKAAAAAWRALADESPKDFRLWTSLGVALAHEEKYEDAVAAYRKALAIAPKEPQIQLDLGLAYFKAGKLKDAVQPLRWAADAMPDNAQAQILLGMSLYGTAQYREAVAPLEKAVTGEFGNPQLRSVLAQAYLYAGDYDKAKAEFQQLVAHDPDSPQVHMLLGEAYDALGDTNKAIAEFRAAAAKPNVPMAHFGLGYLLWKAHQYSEAAPEFRAELQSDPKNAQVLAYLGDIAMKTGDRATAADLLRQATDLAPDLRLAHFDLGILAADNRKFTAAIEEFNRAAALAPNDPDPHYRLAHIYQQLNRRGEAQEQFAIVKQLHERTRADLLVKVTGSPTAIPPSAPEPPKQP